MVNLFISLQRRVANLEYKAIHNELQKELIKSWLEVKEANNTTYDDEWMFVVYAWDKPLYQWNVRDILTWYRWYNAIEEVIE